MAKSNRRRKRDAVRVLDGLGDEPEDQIARNRVMGHLRALGRVADAVELTEARLRQDPGDEAAAEQYALSITNAFRLVSADGAAARPQEQAALDRFADRSGLVALQDAVAAYILRSSYRESVDKSVAGWLSIARGWDRAERAALSILVQEQALQVATPLPDRHVGGEQDSPGLLGDFAADADVPAELGERALAWQQHVHYALWQIAEPDPAPGLWCTDIVTGVTRYVEFPAEMIERLPRWGVLYGPVVPVDGIWRSTGNAVQLSPSEADAMAETLMNAIEGLAQDLSGESSKRAFRRAREPVPFGYASPHNVLAYTDAELSPWTAQMMNVVTCSLLPRLSADLHEYRAAPPTTPVNSGAAPAGESWEKHWLDEPVAALHGRTPREAAWSGDWPLLEATLRQFEYEADILAASGQPGADTTYLRTELHLPSDPWEAVNR